MDKSKDRHYLWVVGEIQVVHRKVEMKVTIGAVSAGKDILAIYQNAQHTLTIKVFDDISYEVIRNGVVQLFDMNHWYIRPQSVIKHVENDIASGVYPGVRRIA